MVDSRAKGARAESAAKELLKRYTKLNWQRVPASGALGPEHGMKGDLYLAKSNNRFCVEVKHYKEDQFNTKILTSAKPMLYEWWEQAHRQGKQVDAEPLLIFKHDRSKFFVATIREPAALEYEYVYLSEHAIFIAKLEDWLKYEDIVWA
jgi:hypothetical protein